MCNAEGQWLQLCKIYLYLKFMEEIIYVCFILMGHYVSGILLLIAGFYVRVSLLKTLRVISTSSSSDHYLTLFIFILFFSLCFWLFFMLLTLGVICLRLWLGKADYDSGIVPLAVLYRKSMVSFYNQHLQFFTTDGWRVDLSGTYIVNFFCCILPLVTLSQYLKDVSMNVITVYGLNFSSAEGIIFSVDSGLQNIPLEGVYYFPS